MFDFKSRIIKMLEIYFDICYGKIYSDIRKKLPKA